MKRYGSACAVAIIALTACCLVAQEAFAKGLPPCANAINACGCSIKSPGVYYITATLTTASKTQDCIDIAAPNVSLLLGGYDIIGAGPGSTNVGIKVSRPAKGAGIGYGTVSQFGTGVKIVAPNATVGEMEFNSNAGNGLEIDSTSGTSAFAFDSLNNGGIGVLIKKSSQLELDDFDSRGNAAGGISLVHSKGVRMSDFNAGNTFLSEPGGNGTFGISLSKSSANMLADFDCSQNPVDGIVLKSSAHNYLGSFDVLQNGRNGVTLINSSGNQVSDGDADDNGNYGFWLQGSKKNLVNYQEAVGNTQTGIYIGCAADGGPAGAPCKGVNNSNGNRVADFDVGADLQSSTTIPQKFGVAVDLGDSNNYIAGGFLGGNGGDTNDDYIDENPNCDHNRWVANAGNTSSPNGCIPLTLSVPATEPRPSWSNRPAGRR